MKRLVLAAALVLICIVPATTASASSYKVKRFLTKETTVDMKNMKNVCVGWIDLDPDEWGAHGYDTKAEWSGVIDGLNAQFASSLPAMYLTGRTVVAAKGKSEDIPTGCDVYVKFSDVYVDYDHYHLILSIHFIDPKTGTEIGSIPARPYYGDDWGLRGYLAWALKEVGIKLSVEITGAPPTKTK